MPCSAAGCACGSASVDIASVTTRFCWRRHARRARATMWSISGRASVPQALRSRRVLLAWRSRWSRSMLASSDRAFGAVALLPVHPAPGASAIRILVQGTQGSRAPLALLPALILNGRAGRPTPEAEAVLREAQALVLAAA